jgi:hypothetical protein
LNEQTQNEHADSATAPEVPAPDPKSPVGKALMSLAAALSSATKDAIGESDAQYALAIDSMQPHASLPGMADAILKLERERELSRLNASAQQAYLIRKQYSEAFAELARFGIPAGPSKPTNGKSAGKSGQPAPVIRDADGRAYTKVPTNRDQYVQTGAVACGDCPISEVVLQAPLHTDSPVALGNWRQNMTRRLATMSTAEVHAHADCFDAAKDAEYSFPVAATINEYRA